VFEIIENVDIPCFAMLSDRYTNNSHSVPIVYDLLTFIAALPVIPQSITNTLMKCISVSDKINFD